MVDHHSPWQDYKHGLRTGEKAARLQQSKQTPSLAIWSKTTFLEGETEIVHTWNVRNKPSVLRKTNLQQEQKVGGEAGSLQTVTDV